MNRTMRALLTRGFDTHQAEQLIADGHSLRSLTAMDRESLRQIDIADPLVERLVAEGRPPISDEVLFRLLHECKRTCCVCRNSARPIVIHHIVPWEQSRDHSLENLIVLCPEHHAQAHTRSELTRNLSAAELRAHKNAWIDDVKSQDASAILGLANLEGASWYYINLRRMYELAEVAGVALTSSRHFAQLRNLDILDATGIITPYATWRESFLPHTCLYHTQVGHLLYLHNKAVLEKLVGTLPLADITNSWSRADLCALAIPGAYISIQRAFYFRSAPSSTDNIRKCYYKAKGIHIEFDIDAWEATSPSAWGSHLVGHTLVTAICRVSGVETVGSSLAIKASCLALGGGFRDVRQRMPLPFEYEVFGPDDFEDEESYRAFLAGPTSEYQNGDEPSID